MMRTFLDEGAITFEGDFFQYSGLYTFARPVQERIPIKMGAMKGPRSFQAAGELADGMHQALAYITRGLRLRRRATCGRRREAPGADWTELDNGAWVVTVVSEDSAAAKRPRASSSPSTSPRCRRSSWPATASTLEKLAPVVEALGAGDVPKAISLFEPHYAEKLPLAGTPEEVVEKIKTDLEPAGVNHMILSLADPLLVKLFSGEDVPGVPTSRASSSSSPSG